MARENFDVEVPEGTHLAFSRDTDGAYRAHLFDESNRLVGHAELFEPHGDGCEADPGYPYVNVDRAASQDDESDLAEVLAALLVLGVVVAAQKAAPHLRKWWNDTALPFLKDKRSKLPHSSAPKSKATTPGSAVVVAPAPVVSDDLFTALDEYRARISSAEARERFVAALAARAFSERQFRLLRNARIEDANGFLELESAMDALTPEQLEDGIRAMLEANPSWPDHETVAELGKLLQGIREGRKALPLQIDDLKRTPGKHRHQQ
jgi:hypothetical protein